MEITKGVHNVDEVNGNCYLLDQSDGWVLIDTGMPNNSKKILSYAEKNLHLAPKDIKTIIITHAHIDHIGSAAQLKSETGAKIASHADDADYISGKKKLDMPAKGMKLRFMLMRFIMPFFKAQPVQTDILLKDGDTIAGLQVLHTPGHTPGSICLIDPKRNVLFVGDLIRFMDGKIIGPPITMDAGQIDDSIKKLAKLDYDIMLSGHGQPLMPKASDKVRQFASGWKSDR